MHLFGAAKKAPVDIVDRSTEVGKTEEVEVRFEGKNLTNVGGIGLIRKFATKLGVERVLEHHVKLPRRAGKYTPGRLLLSLVYAFVLDLTRLSDTRLLKEDKVAHTLLGFGGFPDPSTFSRFLSRFTVRKAQGIGRANVGLMMRARRGLAGLSRITLDLDSHGKTVYGNQQRASVGDNPKKPG
jgi:hypothetical protein